MKRLIFCILFLSGSLALRAADPGGYFLVFSFDGGQPGEPAIMATERYHARPATQISGWRLRVLDASGTELFATQLGDPLAHAPGENAVDARQMVARIPQLREGASIELIDPFGASAWRAALDADFRSRAADTAEDSARLARTRPRLANGVDPALSPAAKSLHHERRAELSGFSGPGMESPDGSSLHAGHDEATLRSRPTYLPDTDEVTDALEGTSVRADRSLSLQPLQGPMPAQTSTPPLAIAITGRIVDEKGQAPGIAFDAFVYSGDSSVQKVPVGRDGSYAFNAEPGRAVRAWLQAPAPFLPAWHDLTVSEATAEDESPSADSIKLDDGVALTIRPKDAAGQSLMSSTYGGWVYLGTDYYRSFGFSNDPAAWTIAVPRGKDVVINFDAPSGRFKPDVGPRAFVADATLDPVFRDIRRLHGVVRRDDGTIHDRAIVRAFDRSTGDFVVSTRSMSTGSYEMNLPPGSYDIRLDARSNQSFINLLYAAPADSIAVVIDQNDVQQDLTLVVPKRTLSASIVSKSALHPPQVTVFSGGQLLSRTFTSRRTSDCDSAGCVTGLDLAISPGVYDVEIQTVDANGLHVFRKNGIDLGAADVAIDYDTTGEDKRWHGTLLDTDGAPSADGYAFSMDATGQIRDNVPVGDDGHFAIAVASGWTVGLQPARHGSGLRETIQVASPETLPATVRHSHIASPSFNNATGLYEIHKGALDRRVSVLFIGDGYTDERETFTDTNGNGVWDGVVWYDLDDDGLLDSDEPYAVHGDAPEPAAGTDPGLANEPFEDGNGDGYLSQDDRAVLIENARSQIRSLLGADYWSDHRDAFEANVAFVASPQAGMDVIDRDGQTLLERETILDGALLRDRSVLYANREAALLLAEQLSPGFDYLVVLINQPIPIGRANTTLGSIPGSMLINGGLLMNYPDSNTFGHEAGHFIGLLADEYDEFPSTSDGHEPPYSNVTTRVRHDDIKWKRWLTADQPLPSPAVPTEGIGLFEGAYYVKGGVYRPSWNSLMRSGNAFDVSALDALDAGLARFTGGSPSLNQFGLTGNWYEPATSGQGLSLEVFQDAGGSGTGTLVGGWFTFDTVAGGADRQRWYILSGPVAAGRRTADLIIHTNYGGNFDAGPVTSAVAVGTAKLTLHRCTAATLEYAFNDGRAGTIDLQRLLDDVACRPAGSPATPIGPEFGLSGNWYDAATSGQGLVFEVNPVARQFFATWFTYAPNGSTVDGAGSQRWYAFQSPIGDDPTRYGQFEIYQRRGGIFDNPAASDVDAIGTGSLRFDGCTRATLAYDFTSGDNAGSSGSIELTRPGPPPPGCGN